MIPVTPIEGQTILINADLQRHLKYFQRRLIRLLIDDLISYKKNVTHSFFANL